MFRYKPLGSCELLRPAMMVNLFATEGGPGGAGEPEYLGLEEALGIPGVALHLYGKRDLRPFRKMGHLTALGPSRDEAIARAEAARDRIRIALKGRP
jgi:5-(carboxyamino)imidazole ribonucleotide synthase